MKNILKKDLTQNIFKYTLCFIIIAGFICSIFIYNDKTFIWSHDGLRQHIITLTYYKDLLLSFLNLGAISTFTWNIETGMDMFGNLTYYIMGDLFSYFALLFNNNEFAYSFLALVRVYFVGISFLIYCNFKKVNTIGTIIGSLTYTFSFFVLFSFVRHPYFMNALILFPLLLMAVERMILYNKKIFLILITAVTFISSWYFGYMMSLIVAIYGAIILINKYKKDYKKIIKILFKTLFYALIGILISAVLLIPSINEFLLSARSGGGLIKSYSYDYYAALLPTILTGSEKYWTYLGTSALVVIVLPMFFRNFKQNKNICILFLILLLPILISQIGFIFDGFSFPNNRWSFVFPFLISYMTAITIKKDMLLNKKDIKNILIFATILLMFVLCTKILGLKEYKILFINLMLFALMFVSIKKTKKFASILITLIVINLSLNAFYFYKDGYINEFANINESITTIETNNESNHDFKETLNKIKEDEDFYRILRDNDYFINTPLLMNYKSISGYYSINPNYYNLLGQKLENREYGMNTPIKNFDLRTKITTLLNNKYYVTTNNLKIPYGYSLQKTVGKTNIYKNNYNLPFAVLYQNYITEGDYENLSSLEKEDALLKAAKTKNNKNLEYTNIDSKIKEIKYKANQDVKKSLTIKKLKDKIKLHIDGNYQGELYLNIKNLNYKKLKRSKSKINFEIKANYNNITLNEVEFIKSKSPYYFKQDEILINLGYYKNIKGDITINLTKGEYEYDDLKLYAVEFSDYEESINNLKKSNFKIKDYGNNYIDATVNTEKGLLQFSTMYNKGFTVYVDGKEVETFVSNDSFLAINIEKGIHKIHIEYHTPYLKLGLYLSSLGILILLIIIIKERKNGRNNKKFNKKQ